jgi:DNA-binding transcriptional LysR family regulator
MDFNTLKYFVDIANSLNFTQAAKKNFISQPAISAKIKGLEEELGQVLIIRDHHHVELTSAGMVFLKYSKQLLATYNQAIADLLNKQTSKDGQLKVSLYIAPQFQRFINQLASFKKSFSHTITIKINERYSTNAINDVLNGISDLGWGIVDQSINKLVWKPEMTDRFVIVGNTGSLSKFKKPIKISELKAFKFLKLKNESDQFFEQHINLLLEEDRFTGPVETFSSTDLLTTQLLMDQNSFTILPQTQVPQISSGIDYAPIDSQIPITMNSGWFYRKGSTNPALKAFFAYLPYE